MQLITHPVIVFFLLANLAIGFWAHRKSKAGSFEDYALASRSLPTGVLVMTLLGTFLSAGHFAGMGWVSKFGVLFLIPFSFIIGLCWLIGTFLAPYLVYFENMITTGDLMGSFYGRFAQMVTGIIAIIFAVIIISGQLKAIGRISAHFLEVDSLKAIVCFGIIIVLYSSWGGMRAVSYTDVLQMVLTNLMILLVMNILMRKVGGIHKLVESIPPTHTAFFSHPDFSIYLRYVFFAWIIPIDLLSPPIVQRMLISDKRQVRKMWYIGSFFLFLTFASLLCVTFSSFALGIKVDVGNQEAVTTLFLTVVDVLLKGEWMRQFLCISMLSVAISTLDSYLHTLGIVVVQDLLVPIRSFLSLAPLKASQKTLFSRCGILLLGSLAVFVSYLSGASLEFIRMFHFAKFFSPIVIVPLVIGIVGIKTDRMSWLSFFVVYLIVMGCVYPTELLYNGKGGMHARAYFHDCFILASFLAMVSFFITHIYLNGGIVTLKRSEQTVAEQLWIPTWQGCVDYLKSWLLAPFNLPIVATQKVANNPTQSLSLSMVIFALYSFSSVVVKGGDDVGLANFMLGLHVVGITLCIGLMLEGVWPEQVRPYFPLYWFFTLGYCLVFGSTLAFLREHGGSIEVGKWIVNFILLAFLVDSMSFITLSCLGSGFAFAFWYVVSGSLPPLAYSVGLTGGFIWFALLVAVLLFGRRRERGLEEKFYLKSAFSYSMMHESNQPLSEISFASTVQQKALETLSPIQNAQGEKGFFMPASQQEEIQQGQQQIGKAVQQVKHEFGRFNKLIAEEISTLNQEEVSMKSLLASIIPTLPRRHTSEVDIKVKCTQDFKATLLRPLFGNLMANLLKNAYLHGHASEMDIHIDGANRKLHVRDNGSGIRTEILPHIFELRFTTGGQSSTGVGLALAKIVVEASGGKISCHSRHGDKNSFTEFVMKFPEPPKK